MNVADLSRQALSELLTSLGFAHEIDVQEADGMVCLQIVSQDAKFIIGEDGDRLDDLQYLVNRMVQNREADAPRVKVDCDHYRERSEQRLIRKARTLAERVLETGKPVRMQPLNAYHRRLVHNALAQIAGIATTSEEGVERYKRITILPA